MARAQTRRTALVLTSSLSSVRASEAWMRKKRQPITSFVHVRDHVTPLHWLHLLLSRLSREVCNHSCASGTTSKINSKIFLTVWQLQVKCIFVCLHACTCTVQIIPVQSSYLYSGLYLLTMAWNAAVLTLGSPSWQLSSKIDRGRSVSSLTWLNWPMSFKHSTLTPWWMWWICFRDISRTFSINCTWREKETEREREGEREGGREGVENKVRQQQV